jgi:hypothetical protein
MGNTPPPKNMHRALFSTTGLKQDPPLVPDYGPKFAAATHTKIGDGSDDGPKTKRDPPLVPDYAVEYTEIGDGSNDGPRKKKVRVAAETSAKGGIQPQKGDGTDDKDADYIPVTNAAPNEEVDGWTAHLPDQTMREKHRKAFMALAFPPKKDDEE